MELKELSIYTPVPFPSPSLNASCFVPSSPKLSASLTLFYLHHPCNAPLWRRLVLREHLYHEGQTLGKGSESVCCRVSPQLPTLPAFASNNLSRHPSLLTHAHVFVRPGPMTRAGAQTVRDGIGCCLRGHLRRMVWFGSAFVRCWSVISCVRLQHDPNPNPNGLALSTCVCNDVHPDPSKSTPGAQNVRVAAARLYGFGRVCVCSIYTHLYLLRLREPTDNQPSSLQWPLNQPDPMRAQVDALAARLTLEVCVLAMGVPIQTRRGWSCVVSNGHVQVDGSGLG